MKTKESYVVCKSLEKEIKEIGEQMLTSIKKNYGGHAEKCYENIKFIKENKISSNSILTDEMKENLIDLCDFYMKQCPKEFLPNIYQKAEYTLLKKSIIDIGELVGIYIEKNERRLAKDCYDNINFTKEKKVSCSSLLSDEMKKELIQLCEHYMKKCSGKFRPYIPKK